MREKDAEFYAGLEKAGFWLDWGDDGSGLFMKYLRRGSGYYIDVGASQLDHRRQDQAQSGIGCEPPTETAVVLEDGTELPADVIVYATGYGSMNGWAADLIGQDVADKVGKCWGLGSDTTKDPGPWVGEQRNMWKPTAAGGAVVPRRQPAPVAALFAVPGAATEGADGGHPDAGLRPGQGASPEVTGNGAARRRPSSAQKAGKRPSFARRGRGNHGDGPGYVKRLGCPFQIIGSHVDQSQHPPPDPLPL